MSWQTTNWAASQRTGDPVLKVLLIVLANFSETDECWASQKRISYDSEIPERTLRRKLAELSDLGFIRIEERRREDGVRMTNVVRLLMDQPSATVAAGESQRPNTGGTRGQKGGSPSANMVADKQESNKKELELVSSRAKPIEGHPWPDDMLDQFWDAFPPGRRQGKRLVGNKLIKLRRKGLSWDTLIDGVRRYAASDPGEYAKAPMAWLNGELWDSEYRSRGGSNATNRNGSSKVGFSGLAAKLRQEIRDEELFDRGYAPEDLSPVNGR